MELLALALGLGAILLGAELFTNGVEWLGRKLGLAQGAVGGVLAAVGTALPETVIPFVAIVMAGSSASQAGAAIGVGAILGSPFMIATLAMFVTGVGVLGWRGRRSSGTRLVVDTSALSVDIRYFVLAYAIALSAAVLPPDLGVLRYAAVAGSLLVYLAYVRRQWTAERSDEDEPEILTPLRLGAIDVLHQRGAAVGPRLWTVVVQVLVAVSLIIFGAILFVDAVQEVSLALGIDPALLALLIAPVATELPEMVNSLIWVRGNKDTLAMGNLTGAMVFQASIPTAIGISLASDAWAISADSALSFASAAICLAAVTVIFVPMARRGVLSARHLLVGGAFYVLYVGVVVAQLAGAW